MIAPEASSTEPEMRPENWAAAGSPQSNSTETRAHRFGILYIEQQKYLTAPG
jgi:hypothetical protein